MQTRFQMRFETIPDFILTSKSVVVQLMDRCLMHLFQMLIYHDISAGKVESLQIFWLLANFLYSFVIFLADGKEVHQIAGYLTMLGEQTFRLFLAPITWGTQDFLCAMLCWFHTEVYGIISRNGHKAGKGIYYYTVCMYVSLHQMLRFRPANYQELFNLRHSSLQNAIERIFGICKRRFKLMVVAPEYDLRTQAKIPLALAALHNFIRLLNPTDEAYSEEDLARDGLERRESGSISMDINPDHLGSHISQAEKEQANIMRDTIARAMWTDYQRLLEEGMEVD